VCAVENKNPTTDKPCPKWIDTLPALEIEITFTEKDSLLLLLMKPLDIFEVFFD